MTQEKKFWIIFSKKTKGSKTCKFVEIFHSKSSNSNFHKGSTNIILGNRTNCIKQEVICHPVVELGGIKLQKFCNVSKMWKRRFHLSMMAFCRFLSPTFFKFSHYLAPTSVTTILKLSSILSHRHTVTKITGSIGDIFVTGEMDLRHNLRSYH